MGLTPVTYDGSGMAFQALLFCPDDKTARTVTQVLGELEFTVEACTEPFAAVKKLMGQHFDALVVDCDNEQNATLLFKSARNSTSNQASLAVAIVEGQAGVAKAFRIGANLVLTKPINVEQSKGTLRVARGLLRKAEPAKSIAAVPAVPAAPPAAPIPAAAANVPVAASPLPPVKPAPTRPLPPAKPAVTVAPAATVAARPVVARPAPPPVAKPAISVAEAQAAASSGLAPQSEIDDAARLSAEALAKTPVTPPAVNKITPPAPVPQAPKPPAVPPPVAPSRPVFVGAPEGPVGSFSGGTASAPAPARETPVVPAPQPTSPTVPHKAEDLFEKPTAPPVSTTDSPAVSAAPAAPSFTFGGANTEEESGGGKKKIMLGIVAAALVAAGLYAGWSYFQGRASQPVNHVPAVSTPSTAAPSSGQPAPQKPAASIPVPGSHTAAVDAQPTATPGNSETASEVSTPAEVRNTVAPTSAAPPPSKSTSSPKPAETPLVVKGGTVPVVQSAPAVPDTPAPSVIGMAATGSGGALSNLVDTSSTAPQPILQKLNISQGVSQGLLMKKVQPVYPKTAMTMHIEGVVELAATISKNGDITSVKVVKGDPQLTRAAADAVKQWKYKPYLLNGEPVEITTQVTISFKLPH